jgi:uracil-DNA glycosylase family 4
MPPLTPALPNHPLLANIAQCRLCPLPHTPNPLVWGQLNARIAIVGQAPSRSGHVCGIPWYDASGKLLRQWLGVTEAQFYQQPGLFYLTALAHCYPGKRPNGGGDAPPPKLCWDTWVKQEVATATPLLWVTVGRVACHALLGAGDFTQTVFSSPHTYHGVPLLALPHPSPANKRWHKQYPAFAQQQVPLLQQQVAAIVAKS